MAQIAQEIHLPYGIKIDCMDNGTTGITSQLLREFTEKGKTPDAAARVAASSMDSLLLSLASLGVIRPDNQKLVAEAIKVSAAAVAERLDTMPGEGEAVIETPLNDTQKRVAERYADGEFRYVTTEEAAREVGDGLFFFLIAEAHDVPDANEFKHAMSDAIHQLGLLRFWIGDENYPDDINTTHSASQP